MFEESEKQMKVCCTCIFWSYQHKGFCHRLEQGAGKFWMCEDWTAMDADAAESLPETLDDAAAGSLEG
uniref:Uncharacterized protein n=1 Tax=Desulfobacca acetoxidans TaxID=60893 RepID=A0A7V6DQL3_9BACT